MDDDPLRDLIAEVDGVEQDWRIRHQSLTTGGTQCPVVLSEMRCTRRRVHDRMTCEVHDPEGPTCAADPQLRAQILLVLAEYSRKQASTPLPKQSPRGSPTFLAKSALRCWMCGGQVAQGAPAAQFTSIGEAWVGHPSCVDAALRAAANRFDG